MTLAELLTPDRVIADMQSDELWPAIAELVEHLVNDDALTETQKDTALAALKAREEQRSTGIGGGIAIPHCFLPGIEEVIAVFARSRKGVDFCALDRAPVHFIVLFLVPEAQYTLHLKTLAAIAKILNSAETRKRLSEAENNQAITAVLSEKAASV
ncbi:MAG: PTS sugar transporter subunit IIA [Verrucomicrobiales bacterium]